MRNELLSQTCYRNNAAQYESCDVSMTNLLVESSGCGKHPSNQYDEISVSDLEQCPNVV